MAATQRESFFFPENFPVKIVKLKVKEGSNITIGQILFQFEPEESPLYDKESVNSQISNGPSKHVVRAYSAGMLEKLYVNEGDVVKQGSLILEYSSCSHPTVMKEMCAECGADLREIDQRSQTAAVAMVHNIPELMVSMKEATQLGKADEKRLLKDRKLVLLVDLDQTLIHTTNDQIPPNIEDVFHFQLHGPNSPWYHTRLRPFTKELLCSMSSLYELHICTFGSRTYAHMIANFLDEEGRYFSHRILSRDECFSTHSKTANLKALFPCGDHMVVIIDDREDVWNFAPNLIHVRPYHFFQHTGDINAPPGLAKHEKDDKEGFDFTSLNQKKKTSEGSSSEVLNGSTSKSEEDKKSPVKVLSDEDVGTGTQVGDEVTKTPCKDVEAKQDDGAMGTADDMSETKVIAPEKSAEGMKENSKESEEPPLEKTVEENVPKQTESSEKSSAEEEKAVEENVPKQTESSEKSSTEEEKAVEENVSKQTESNKSEKSSAEEEKAVEENVSKQIESSEKSSTEEENGQIHIRDTDDYLLHLQDILRKIHCAYYELYDDNRENGEETKVVPDMKIVLPYVRRKTLKEVHVVFSGVVPTNTPLEKSKPYLVAKSLGAIIMGKVSEKTTHIIAARLGTAKLIEAKKYKHIRVVTPDWLWACAERWERVEERLYPLNSEFATVRRKPPAHCTSPDVAFQLAIAASVKDEQDAAAAVPYYDRVTGKRVVRQPKRSDKGKTLATPRSSNTQKKFCETVNPLLSLSVDEIADMDREVEDILQNSDCGETDEEQEPSESSEQRQDKRESTSGQTEVDESPSRKRKLEVADHNLVIGEVIDQNNPENDTLMIKFRRGESIPVLDGDEPDDEDSNEPEIDELESDEEAEDSELCLAGQALEREFLSEED